MQQARYPMATLHAVAICFDHRKALESGQLFQLWTKVFLLLSLVSYVTIVIVVIVIM